MNELLTPPPALVLLKISFDADQQSEELNYIALRETAPTPDPQPAQGGHADSLYFAPGEQVAIQIICSGGTENGFASFQIVDCAILTRPQVVQRAPGMRTQFASPSPFLQAIGAWCPLALDFQATIEESATGSLVVAQQWKRTLDVGYSAGFWDLSFVMTVRITRGAGAVDEVRVFSFDPECEVGTTGTLKERGRRPAGVN
ncbi:MAG: hypothetical protein V4693_10040 [Pseudomonadota bacterium]